MINQISPEDAQGYRRLFFFGLNGIQKRGSPGTAVGFGSSSFSLLQPGEATGPFVASKFGQGRIIALSHNGYFLDIKNSDGDIANMRTRRFMRSAVIWATRREQQYFSNEAEEGKMFGGPDIQTSTIQPYNIHVEQSSSGSSGGPEITIGSLGLNDGDSKRIISALDGKWQFIGTRKNTFNDLEWMVNRNPSVIFWSGGGGSDVIKDDNSVDIRVSLLRRYVYNGGALIVALCPWGWSQGSHVHPDQSIYNRVMGTMGVSFTDGYAGGDENNLFKLKGGNVDGGETLIGLLGSVATELERLQHPKASELNRLATGMSALPNALFGNPQMYTNNDELPDTMRDGMIMCRHAGQVFSRIAASHGIKFPVQFGTLSDSTPIETVGGWLFVVFYTKIWRTMDIREITAAPSLAPTPGESKQQVPRLQNFLFMVNPMLERRQSMGVYVPAGEDVRISVSDQALTAYPDLEFYVTVGVHTDGLAVTTSDKKYKLERWPHITAGRSWTPKKNIVGAPPNQPLQFECEYFKNAKTMSLRTPFGGLLQIEYKKGLKQDANVPLVLKIEGGIMSPYFNLQKEAGEMRVLPEFESYRVQGQQGFAAQCAATGAPYGEIEGRYIVLSVPTYGLSKATDAGAVANFWDSVVSHELALAGQSLKYKERIVNDKQISAGYMHSGYPVMTFLDVVEPKNGGPGEEMNFEKLLKNPSWGFFHELGHNRQRGDWTFDGTTETTVNIFSMYVCTMLYGMKPSTTPWVMEQVKGMRDFLGNSKMTFKNAGCCAKLGAYAILIDQYGWQWVADLFREYEGLKDHPKNTEQKMEQWILRSSSHVKVDLRPFYKQWKWEVNFDRMEGQLGKFPVYQTKCSDYLSTWHK